MRAPCRRGLASSRGRCFLLSPQVNYTGASINPARSLGPAVITNVWDDHWVSALPEYSRRIARGPGFKLFPRRHTQHDRYIFGTVSLSGFYSKLIRVNTDWCSCSFQVYWVGPILGGLLATLIYHFLLDKMGSRDLPEDAGQSRGPGFQGSRPLLLRC